MIGISSIDNPSIYDISDASFTIKPELLNITYYAKRIPDSTPLPILDGVFDEPFWSLVDQDSLLYGDDYGDWRISWTNFTDNLVSWRAVWSDRSNKLYVAMEGDIVFQCGQWTGKIPLRLDPPTLIRRALSALGGV